eukprot:EG_transcript_18707
MAPALPLAAGLRLARRTLTTGAPGHLYNWVYSSRCRIRNVTERDLERILAVARRHNLRDGITGLLLFVDGVFIQALEGEEAMVKAAQNRIIHDHRHSNVQTLHEGPLSARNFPHWSMGYATPGAEHVRAHGLASLLEIETNLPADADINDLSARAVKLLNAFVAAHATA